MGANKFVALLASGSLFALAMPALAQEAPVDASAAADNSDDGAIVVTANKREERLQDVPISVSVVTGDQLGRQNVNDLVDLARTTPSLNNTGVQGAISIRGVGGLSFTRSSEGSVGVVVDGVALASTSNYPPMLFDVARVEVLEGPQGTLFGRNSSAGLLNMVTVKPDPTKTELILHSDIATRDAYTARGVVNLPIAANAALRVSGAFSQQADIQKNLFKGDMHRQRTYGGRARLWWEPIADLAFNLTADYTNYDKRGGTPWTVYASTPGSPLSQRLAACGVTVEQENQQGCIDGINVNWTETYGLSGQIDATIGDHTLTSITAYRSQLGRTLPQDVDSTQALRFNQEVANNTHNISQELRLTSPAGGFVEYVAGAYFFDSKFHGHVQNLGPLLADLGVPFPLGGRVEPGVKITSLAVFGQATINATDALRFVLGARYGSENVLATSRASLTPGAVAPLGPLIQFRGQAKDNYFSYRLGVQYDLTDDVMAYATYTRGYKGPSVNDGASGPNIDPIVRPEIPKSGEVGVKADLFGGRATASLAGFYTKITDFQAQFFDPTAAVFVYGNAPSLTTKGATLTLFGRPMQGLSLNAGLSYTDARYGDGYVVTCAQGQTLAQGCEPIFVNGVQTGTGDDAGGNRLAGSPKWKATVSGEYEAAISSNAEVFVQADMVYTSKINFQASYSPLATNAAAAIFGGRLGVRFDDDRFGVSLFARNLFDVYRPITRFATPVAAQQRDPRSFSQLTGPESRRTIGLSLDARF
ncbi:TonB-dependent receptor [Sphingopyxis sp. LC81]|uniref:TonB-dependent receptor n=1 Tax=Sphingopyxis sp. LC81 TaxID=1502850 RepID=UPI00050F7AF1|nr:TonB-dependent receptor [Sphingopyxis sp. LC81]KGB54484.1 TonB-dependent receptor [Sphingopyxis sp. LC81]